jgi:hypothetical protein
MQLNEKVKHKCTWMWIMHFLKTTYTKASQNFQDLGAIHNDTCDIWLTCNKFNSNITSLINIKFEIKN